MYGYDACGSKEDGCAIACEWRVGDAVCLRFMCPFLLLASALMKGFECTGACTHTHPHNALGVDK